MAEKTQKEMVRELCQAVIGLPENPDDNGLIGKVQEVKDIIVLQNTRIRKNEQRISKIWGILIGFGALGGGGLGISLSRLLGD